MSDETCGPECGPTDEVLNTTWMTWQLTGATVAQACGVNQGAQESVGGI